MKIIHKTEKKRYMESILLAIGFIGLIACFTVGTFLIYSRIMAFQQNIIGAIYQENETAGKEYLYTLFEPIADENIAASKEAMEKFGFTDRGLYFLGKSMGVAEYGIPVFLMELFMLGLFLYALHCKKNTKRREVQKLEARISELEANVLQEEYLSEQNRKIQNFIENVAHQIKTPVSRVFTSLDLLETDIKDEEKLARIEECYSHLESVNVLMKRLMDVGRLEAGKVIFRKEKICFAELLTDAIKSCCSDMQRVHTQILMEDTEYYGDYEWLKEAFVNIINNALESDQSGNPVEICCQRTQDHLKISVRDHGPGLNEKDIPNVFDRFYFPEQTKVNHTGIGLNLAKLIVEGHYGDICVYNHLEGGAVFHVILPLYALKEGKVR